MNIIEVENLSKSFKESPVFQDISFNVKEGSFLALLGKNGSGKSTILNILLGIEKMDKGNCYLFGEEIKRDPFQLKNKIGHVSEKIHFDYPLTVELFLESYGRFYERFDHDFIKNGANELGIPLNKQFGGYSRGQKMQIVLLAAMAHEPKLLLIDEVTSVLDASARKYFMTLLKGFTEKGGTVVITTNIVNEVQYYCDEVIFLDEKKIKFQTEISQIPASFKKIRVKDPNHSVLNQPGVIWVGINSDGSQSYIAPEDIFQAFTDIETDKRAVTLEDLYIYHSQKGAI